LVEERDVLFNCGREIVVSTHLRSQSLLIEVVDFFEDYAYPLLQVAAGFTVKFIELPVKFHHRVLPLGIGPCLPVGHQFQNPVLDEHHSDLFGGNTLGLEMLQIVVDAAESQVDGVFTLVVHANADQYLDSERLSSERTVPRLHVHLTELIDQSVCLVDFSEVGDVWRSLVVVLGDIISLDGASKNAERAAGVVDLLLKDSG
jgi:hypothetical protein